LTARAFRLGAAPSRAAQWAHTIVATRCAAPSPNAISSLGSAAGRSSPRQPRLRAAPCATPGMPPARHLFQHRLRDFDRAVLLELCQQAAGERRDGERDREPGAEAPASSDPAADRAQAQLRAAGAQGFRMRREQAGPAAQGGGDFVREGGPLGRRRGCRRRCFGLGQLLCQQLPAELAGLGAAPAFGHGAGAAQGRGQLFDVLVAIGGVALGSGVTVE